MRKDHALSDGFRPWLCLALAFLISLPVVAQEADDEAEDEQQPTTEADAASAAPDDDEVVEQVIVTGSRIKRSTYTSIAPLQIIRADVKREAGIIDASEILQEATTASGVQIDLSYSGFVLDDGPGTTTLNLRGLGANRTLVLLNGRRLAPTGVEGAPSSPNLSIVPGLLVQQYDQLLDGASSIYGSDAVAGVTNAILRKDFDGFTIEMAPAIPHHDGGTRQIHSFSWGRNWDRGFIGGGVQYNSRDAVKLADRPWTAGCERNYEIDQNGNIRNRDLWWATNYSAMEWDDCAFGSLSGYTQAPGYGWNIYHTPGYSNGNWPNFSESNSNWRNGILVVDGDMDGKADVSFRDYSSNGRAQERDLISAFDAVTAMAYGEYTLEGEANLTPYFEVLYGGAGSEVDSRGQLSFWPWVPATNPYNLCNPEAEGGVDCGLALDALYSNPGFIAGFSELYGETCAAQGIPATECSPHAIFPWATNGEIGPLRTRPVVRVRGDRNFTETDTTWYRGVAGLKGDAPFLNVGTLADWTFDASITRSHSSATSSRPGIREDRFNLAMGYYSNDWTPCENNIGEEERKRRTSSIASDPLKALIAPDAAPGCVSVNMYAPSLYEVVDGDFGTAAERDYLIDSRDFKTEYTQTLFSLYLTGDLFSLPAGTVAGGVGFEYRVDDIASIPDQVAAEGLLWGFFADGGAVGDKSTREFFGEIELPLLAGKPGAQEVVVNLSARHTDDEFYGGAWTGSAKLGWRPLESLLVRATWGTSYRAPNLRELFLRDQTGFFTVTDPCFIPTEAMEMDEASGERRYNPDLDLRDPFILQRCREEGVDPTVAGDGQFTTYSVESGTTGASDLNEETSESMSLGFAWEQPFTKVFGLTLGMTYYDIEIEDTIIEPTVGYIVFDCYISRNSTGQFCSRIRRNLDDAVRPDMLYVNRGFINRDEETVRGVDLNLTFDTTFTVFERALDLSLDVIGHRLIERNTLFVNDAGDQTLNQNAREWYFAEHKAELALRVDYDRWRLSWQSRYIGDYENYRGADDEWGDINSSSGVFSDTCAGPPDDVQCKDVQTASDYWVHHLSTTYAGDDWRVVAGLRNVFDESPPQVNGDTGTAAINNTPRGLGYDLMGRTYFVTATYSFGGEGN